MDELSEFQRQYRQRLLEEEKEEIASHAGQINAFSDFMRSKGVVLTADNFKYQQTVGIIATYPNIITLLHPSLIADKEGLFVFDNLLKHFERRGFANGYLYADNFMLMAHPYFRRGFHAINNFAPRFVELFWNHTDPMIEKFILLDNDRVRINVDNSTYMEFDTWFGAKFNRDIRQVPDGIVKVRPPADIHESHISFFFSDAYSLDVKWTTKNSIKSFQAEEFKTEAIKIIKDGKEYFPVRYVHAEFDMEKNFFRHFDGAIHFYTETEYYARRDADFNYNSKEGTQIKTLSQKLFKMNGVVTVDTWITFTSHFLTGNPLVFEYFEGEYPEHITDMLQKVRKANQKD